MASAPLINPTSLRKIKLKNAFFLFIFQIIITIATIEVKFIKKEIKDFLQARSHDDKRITTYKSNQIQLKTSKLYFHTYIPTKKKNKIINL